MSTLILAIENPLLLTVCHQALMRGHVSIVLHSVDALMTLPQTVTCDMACIDGSDLGQAVLDAIEADRFPKMPLVGIGIKSRHLAAEVPLPLSEEALMRAVQGLLRAVSRPAIQLNTSAHIACFGEDEVNLTPTEFRLLEVLHSRQPMEVSVDDLVLQIWGFTEDRGTSPMIRTHVRNLRRKLAQIGLPDAVRSRRGRGYSLVL